MEPNLLPIKKARKFRSEAEYRLWQLELAADTRQGTRGEGLVSRIVNSIRKLAPQQTEVARKETQRVHGRSGRRPAKQHS